MLLKLDAKAERFTAFLDLFNLLKRKTESGQEIQISNKLIDLRFKLENTDWEQDEILEQISTYRDLIDEETRKIFADNRKFCLFLFGTDSIYDVYPKPVKGEEAISRKELGRSVCKAIASFQNFTSNYHTFPNLMFYIERNRTIAELQREIGIDRLFSTSWSEIGMVSYLLTEKGQLEVSLNQNEFFYGFRDFERIFRCKRCDDYFLARRKDANFCSDKCRNAFKHKEWLKKPTNRKNHLEWKKKYYRDKLKKSKD